MSHTLSFEDWQAKLMVHLKQNKKKFIPECMPMIDCKVSWELGIAPHTTAKAIIGDDRRTLSLIITETMIQQNNAKQAKQADPD